MTTHKPSTESNTATEPKTFLFLPESASGPTNNCIGIGNELVKMGHRVVFAAESSWKDKLTPFGFEEQLFDLAAPDPDADEEEAGAFWKNYINEIKPEFKKTTAEQLETVTGPIAQELIDGAKYAEPRLREIIAEVKPDVIIEDNVVMFPALATSDAPFVRIVSCNPLEIRGENIAPVLSGLAENDPQSWGPFLEEYRRVYTPMWTDFNEWVQEQGLDPMPELELMPEGDLNLYLYPEELDYTDARPLSDKWHRIDSAVRQTETAVDLPVHFTDGSKPLVYFSLGSLGGADVRLMQAGIDALAELPVNVIVSKGPRGDEVTLADNMWGDDYIPQTTLIPLVDLVITHGGNNTVTESMHFGKPMVLMPLFWDQYDNAQRVDECGYGTRVDTYKISHDEFKQVITDILEDRDLRDKAAAAGEKIRARKGLEKAAQLLADFAAQQ